MGEEKKRVVPRNFFESAENTGILYLEHQKGVLAQIHTRFPAVMQEAIKEARKKVSEQKFCLIIIESRHGINKLPAEIRCSEYLLPDGANFEVHSSTQPMLLRECDVNGRRIIIDTVSVIIS